MSIWTRKKFWITKEGRRITPGKMDDTHLQNTLNLLRSWAAFQIRYEIESLFSHPEVTSDAACDEWDRQLNHWEGLTPHEYLELYLPIYPRLITEAENRN